MVYVQWEPLYTHEWLPGMAYGLELIRPEEVAAARRHSARLIMLNIDMIQAARSEEVAACVKWQITWLSLRQQSGN